MPAHPTTEAPPAAWFLLGYAALWGETVEDLRLALDSSKKFLYLHPNSSGALLNRACAAAQLFGKVAAEPEKSSFRKQALEDLTTLFNGDREKTEQVKKQVEDLAEESHGDFYSLREDPEFKKLLE